LSFGTASLSSSADDDDIGLESHQFRDRFAKPFGLSFPRSPFDDGGATLDIAQFLQPLAQDLLAKVRRAGAGNPRNKDTDSSQAGRLLCLGGERHREEPTRSAADERTPIHH
jgi:hypothetical protein